MRYLEIPGYAARLHAADHPDGPRLASVVVGHRRHFVFFSALDDGRHLGRREFRALAGVPDPAVSPDADLVAFADKKGRSLSLFVERLGRPEQRRQLAPAGRVRAWHRLAFAPDGSLLASADGDLLRWHLPDDPFADADPLPCSSRVDGADSPTALAGGPGKLLALGSEQGRFRLSLDGSSWLDLPLGRDEAVLDVAFAPDGRAFAVAVGPVVVLWAVEDSAPVARHRLQGHAQPVRAVAFAPDGRTLASAASDGTVRVWDVAAGRQVAERDWRLGGLHSVAFSLDGEARAAGGVGRVVLWGRAEMPESAPAEAEAEGTRWEEVEDFYFPEDAVVVGHEHSGELLYAARGAHDGGVYPGKVRPGFAGANVGCRGREVALNPFEVLAGQAEWSAAHDGQIPQGAVECGHDGKGTPFYLVRAAVCAGLHPGLIAPGMAAARVPYAGVEVESREYEVLVRRAASAARLDEPIDAAAQALLTWHFDNVMSAAGVSVSVGVPARPDLASGFVSQTGGGPAEDWGQTGTVFLTRHLGTNDVFVWFTVTRPVVLEGLRFFHWHNHNPGFPTHPEYQVQVQLDEGTGYRDVGPPLTLSDATSGTRSAVRIGRRLDAGSYKLRWHPRRLSRGRDTSSEFFAIRSLELLGRPVEH